MTCTEAIQTNRNQFNETYFGVPQNQYKVWTNYALAIAQFGSTSLMITAGPNRLGNSGTEIPGVSLVIPKNPLHTATRAKQGINIATETDQALFESLFGKHRTVIEDLVSDFAFTRDNQSAAVFTKLHSDRDYWYFTFNHLVPATKGKCNRLFNAVLAALKEVTPELGQSLEDSHIALRG